VALLAYGLAAGQFPAEVPRRPEAEYVVAAIVTAVAYMGSLLAHELAHSLVARRNGVAVEGITLWLLGGVSRLQGEIPDPGAEVRVAGVGPLTSLVLGGAFTLVAWLLHASGVGGVVVAALAWLGGINILLAVFNVIPAAPLDGGCCRRSCGPLPRTGSRRRWGPPGPGRCSGGPSSWWAPIWCWPGGTTAGCGSSFSAGS